MYYPYFVTYILTGVIIGLLVFVWALKNDQFSDQQRARFLPLEDKNPGVIKQNFRGRIELVLIFFLAIAGIISSFAIIAYALLSH